MPFAAYQYVSKQKISKNATAMTNFNCTVRRKKTWKE